MQKQHDVGQGSGGSGSDKGALNSQALAAKGKSAGALANIDRLLGQPTQAELKANEQRLRQKFIDAVSSSCACR